MFAEARTSGPGDVESFMAYLLHERSSWLKLRDQVAGSRKFDNSLRLDINNALQCIAAYQAKVNKYFQEKGPGMYGSETYVPRSRQEGTGPALAFSSNV